MSKLDILVAEKVMGWKYLNDANGYQVFKEANGERIAAKWHPSTSLDDALLCLERAANGRWTVTLGVNGYWCYIGPRDEIEHNALDKTPALAMCICALRASGVSESLITQAME